MAVLNLLVKISSYHELIPCFFKLSSKYQPSQSEAIVDLLKSVASTAKIFLSCLSPDTTNNKTNGTENNKAFEENSKKIIEAW